MLPEDREAIDELIREATRGRPNAAGHTPQWRLTGKAEPTSDADLYLYDVIGWPGIGARDVVEGLRAIGTRPLTVHINSPGGDVFDGLAVYNTLRARERVTIKVEGLAGSIASIIAMGSDTRRMANASLLMIHEPHALVLGTGHDMKKMAGLMDKAAGIMADIYARAGADRDQVRRWMHDETWFTAQTALDSKLITAIDDAPASAAPPDPTGPGPAKFDLAGAPARPPRAREHARLLAESFDRLLGTPAKETR